MPVSRIQGQLAAALQTKGKIDASTIDEIMREVRQEGGLSAEEQAALLEKVDGFDESGLNRLNQYLASADQKDGFVNVNAQGTPQGVEGRYETVKSSVPGLTAKVGLFDGVISLSGTAAASGLLLVQLDGQPVTVPVKSGDTPDTVLKALQAKLPAGYAGALLAGDVQPFDMESFRGNAPAPGQAAHLALFKPDALKLAPGEAPLRVVVTGYGDFMGVTKNPSDLLAEKLAAMGLPGAVIEYQRLDVTPEAVNAFVAQMKADPPDVVLSMGMAPSSQIEERPENRLGADEDGAGKPLPAGKIDPSGPDEEQVDLPLPVIDWALDTAFGKNRQVGSSHSDPNYQPDRSAYLCNYLGYRLAETFNGTQTAAGFVHVTETTPPEQMHVFLQAVASHQREVLRGASNIS